LFSAQPGKEIAVKLAYVLIAAAHLAAWWVFPWFMTCWLALSIAVAVFVPAVKAIDRLAAWFSNVNGGSIK
jgi:hypothetical protein